MTDLYRVRHPAAPDLFVWWVKPLRQFTDTVLGTAEVSIVFAQYRASMTKEDAECLAAQCGGTVEKVNL